jgi:hypothetical protein
LNQRKFNALRLKYNYNVSYKPANREYNTYLDNIVPKILKMGTARSTLLLNIHVCIHTHTHTRARARAHTHAHTHIQVSGNGNWVHTYKSSNFRNLGCFLVSYVGKCSFEVSLRNTKLAVRNSQKTQLVLKKKGTGRLFCELCETHE